MSERRPIWAARRFVKTWATLTNAHREKVIEFLIVFPDLTRKRKSHRSDCARENTKPLPSVIYNPLSAPSEPPCEKVPSLKLRGSDLMESPHSHSGFGLKRLRGTFFYEARLDLRWRLILRMSPEEIVLFAVMDHDQVRRL